MTLYRLEPFFLEGSAGRIFLLLRAPTNAQRCVLFVPPFGEEMNKSRRQFTETAESLVAAGSAVILLDLSGTGDSEGDFSNASWQAWKTDVEATMAWADRAGLPVDALIATRLGCALAAESLRDAGRAVSRTIFWQPVAGGRQFMTQFLRLRVAASMMEADTKETVDGLKEQLAKGETLEVAGYPLSSALWQSIEAVDLTLAMAPCLGRLDIFEIGSRADGALSVTGQRLADAALGQGIPVSGKRIRGEPFWAATEIVTSPELKDLTAACLAADTAP